MAQVFNDRDAVVRVIDGTATTSLHVTFSFLGSLEGPAGRTRPDEKLQLNQGKGDSKIHHTISSDAKIFEPVQITLSGKLYDTDITDDIIVALSNPFDDATWKPGGTSVFTGVTSLGTVANADGTAVTFPMPKDAHRAASLVNIAIIWGSSLWGLQYTGVFFEASDVKFARPEDADSTFSATGTVYGAITQISTMPAASTEIS